MKYWTPGRPRWTFYQGEYPFEVRIHEGPDLDSRFSSAAEDDPLPAELQTPIAVATDLLDDSVLATETAPVSEHVETESANAAPEAHPDAGENVSARFYFGVR